MLAMRTKDGTRYVLDDDGAVLARSDGPRGWDYSGKWKIVGFKKRAHSHATVSLADALDGFDVGQGWVIDWDHGTYRMWAHPTGRRLAYLAHLDATDEAAALSTAGGTDRGTA